MQTKTRLYIIEKKRQKLRFNKENLQYIINLVHDDLVRETFRNCAMSDLLQPQTVLQFLVTNSFHQGMVDVIVI